MNLKEKKLNKKKVIGLILILLFIITIPNIFKNNDENKEISVLFNNELLKLKNNVMIENANIYVSKDDIENLFDKNIYYNEAQKELITAYNSHVAYMKVDENICEINGQSTPINGKLQYINGKIYLPISDLGDVYDLDVKYSSKTNRVIMDSNNIKKEEASLLKRAKLKNKKGIFSSSIEKLIIGDKVVIIEETGNYKKVRTSSGNIGYIKSKVLSENVVIRQNIEYNKKDIKLYNGYTNMSGVYEDFLVDETKLNVINPTMFYIDSDFRVLDKSSTNTATYSIYKAWADRNKLELLPVLENNKSVSSSLFNYSRKKSNYYIIN